MLCENVAKLHNIPIVTSRSRRPPKRFDDGIVLETTGIRDESDNYKINLKRPFSDKNKDIMQALQACCPPHTTFSTPATYSPLLSPMDWMVKH